MPLFRRVLFLAVPVFSLFLVIRFGFVEPFGVPTGSMAPTLVGNHREAACPRCGYSVVVGEPGDAHTPYAHATCPNCGHRGIDLAEAKDIPGDRLLVDKNVYSVRRPRRWEVAVFRCPVDGSTPYVKRVVGLPGESIRVVDGDVYADGVLLRKSLAQVREVRVPVFDMRYAPPGGWAVRWVTDPVPGAAGKLPRARETPAGAVVDESILKEGVVTLDASAAPDAAVGLTYRHWHIDKKLEEPVRDSLAYNDPKLAGGPVAVHDFAVEFDLELVAGNGSFAVRLGDGRDTVAAELGPDGARLGPDGGDPVANGSVRLTPGKSVRVTFAFVDRRASLALDGKEVVPAYDLPADPALLARRGGVSRPVQLGARGAKFTVKNFVLYRDVHYRSDRANEPNGTQAPCPLGPAEYFVLGDNSANSRDSRAWDKPGVPERDFLGKPFLIHQPLRLGRVTVNGTDRTYQTVDWARVKWVR